MAAKYKDGGMLSMDKSKTANLPTEVSIKMYPDPYSSLYMDMEDNVSGIDAQIKGDQPKGKSGYKPSKLN